MLTDEGLRERKKRATREAISQAATALFFERGFQKSALAALRDEVRRLVVSDYVFTKFDPDVLGFWKVVEASPALRARLREVADEACEALAAHFEGPSADLVASLVVAGWRAAYRAGLAAARRGKSPQKAAAEFERVLDATMAAARAAIRAASSG
jgi:AcrR family transcriptional regulator